MRQFVGSWRMDERRDGAARLVLKAPTGEGIYKDFSPAELGELRDRLNAVLPAPPADPKATKRGVAAKAPD